MIIASRVVHTCAGLVGPPEALKNALGRSAERGAAETRETRSRSVLGFSRHPGQQQTPALDSRSVLLRLCFDARSRATSTADGDWLRSIRAQVGPGTNTVGSARWPGTRRAYASTRGKAWRQRK